MSDAGWRILYTKQALKEKKIAYQAGFSEKIKSLIDILKDNPYESYPPYEKLVGDLLGAYSRRISLEHRLIYSVHKKEKTVKIISVWTHYE